MIAEHGATVIPFTDALLRKPRHTERRLVVAQRRPVEDELADNVVVLARFARYGRRRSHWLGGPPSGEAA